MNDNPGRCNNCWLVVRNPLQDGGCPRCGCHIHHAYARRTVVYHGSMVRCHKIRCPRRFDNAKRKDHGKAG